MNRVQAIKAVAVRDGVEMREGGVIIRQDGSRQLFWDPELLKPYLDAWRLRRQELLGTPV